MSTETPTKLKLDINLPRLNAGELGFLIEWSGSRHEKFPAFTRWLCEQCVEELERRQSEGNEPEMLELPVMDGEQWSDFLAGTYVLSRMPLPAAVARFVDDLSQHVVCHLAATLGELGERFQA